MSNPDKHPGNTKTGMSATSIRWTAVIAAGLVAAAILYFVLHESPYAGVPKRAVASIEAGDIALARDSVEQALHHYFDAVDLDPTLADVFGKIAEGYYLAGLKHKANRNTRLMDAMFSQSRIYIQESFRIRPNEPHGMYVSGLLDYEDGQLDSAISKMSLSESMGLRYFNLHVSLGFMYNEKGEPGLSLEEFQRAYDIRPDDPVVLYNLGELYYQVGNYGKAVDRWSELVQLNPKDNHAKANYAAAIWKNGDENQAKSIFNEIINGTKGREFIGYNIVGWVLIDKNVDPAWGLKLAQAADALKPNNIETTDILGWGYYMTGDYENAVKYLNKSMLRKPSDEVKQRLQLAKDKLEDQKAGRR